MRCRQPAISHLLVLIMTFSLSVAAAVAVVPRTIDNSVIITPSIATQPSSTVISSAGSTASLPSSFSTSTSSVTSLSSTESSAQTSSSTIESPAPTLKSSPSPTSSAGDSGGNGGGGGSSGLTTDGKAGVAVGVIAAVLAIPGAYFTLKSCRAPGSSTSHNSSAAPHSLALTPYNKPQPAVHVSNYVERVEFHNHNHQPPHFVPEPAPHYALPPPRQREDSLSIHSFVSE